MRGEEGIRRRDGRGWYTLLREDSFATKLRDCSIALVMQGNVMCLMLHAAWCLRSAAHHTHGLANFMRMAMFESYKKFVRILKNIRNPFIILKL